MLDQAPFEQKLGSKHNTDIIVMEPAGASPVEQKHQASQMSKLSAQLCVGSWFRVKGQHDKFWLNQAIRDCFDIRKADPSIHLTSNLRKEYDKLLVQKQGIDAAKAKEMCETLLKQPKRYRNDEMNVLMTVAKCCAPPTIVQQYMFRYCVHMRSNLTTDSICLGFCIETIAVTLGLTLVKNFETVLSKCTPEDWRKFLTLSTDLVVDAATQYIIFTRNSLWTPDMSAEQREANGKLFRHRYTDLLEFASWAHKKKLALPSRVTKVLRQFRANAVMVNLEK